MVGEESCLATVVEGDHIMSVAEHLFAAEFHAAYIGEVNCEQTQREEGERVDVDYTFPRDSCAVALQRAMVARYRRLDGLDDKGCKAAVAAAADAQVQVIECMGYFASVFLLLRGLGLAREP